MSLGHLQESWLATKDLLTHCPSPQGWASRCPMFCVYVCVYVVSICVCGVGVHVAGLGSFLPLHSFCTLSASVLYTCIFMYILHVQCRGRYRGAGGGARAPLLFIVGGLTPPLSCANCRLHTLPRMCIVKIYTTQEPFIIHTSSPHTCTCNSQSTTGTCRYMYLMHNTICYTCTVSSTLVVMETCHIQL